MDRIEEIINDRLKEINFPQYEELNPKTQKRLKEIEEFVMNSTRDIKELIERIRKLKLSKSNIANSKNTSFTRKTIYNDALLEQYIEKCIEVEPDYFNERKIEQLYNELNELREQYNQILDNIIHTNLLRIEVENCKKEVLKLTEEKEKRDSMLDEKDKIIKNLKSIMYANNITNVDILPTRESN